jgi:CubicO group peptidase (beta-lactamase class C family)
MQHLRLSRRAFISMGTGALAFLSMGAAASDELETFVNEKMKTANIPGMAIGFAKNGRTMFTRGYGFADVATRRRVDADTIFHIASISKTVTATAVMMLVEDGLLALNDPIDRYLDFPVVNPAHPTIPIRVKHLLMHTSSISEEVYQKIDFRVHGHDTTLALSRFLKDLLAPGGRYYSATGCYSVAPPGANWDYVNTGFALLGYVAGRAAGEDLRAYISKRIFHPLGMRHAAWRLAEVPSQQAAAPYDDIDGRLMPVQPVAFPDWPAGMMRASIEEFTRFLAMSANRGSGAGVTLLGASSMDQMLRMEAPAGLPEWLTGQGLGWAESNLGGVRRPNHWGGDPGVFTVAYLDQASSSGVAIFTNATATTERKAAVKAIANRIFTAGAAI